MSSAAFIDEIRRLRGLMTIGDIEDLVERGNVIFDPFSVLISATAKIGTGNIIFPCVSLFCVDQGELLIGDNNTFFSNSLIEAVSGPIVIGSINQFGEGGFTAKTNRPNARIVIGDNGRYINGASVFGETILGTGSQILGAITVDSCHLEAGHSYKDSDPDLRAGLLKGSGVARNLTVPTGQVILGNGLFSTNEIKPQAFFHPKGK
ncbi:AraC family transcriptional regulator [Rhizobium lemnae]|uniref:AraC family transcriptional regulator n=1 Tax=Rhizobium lemnae TaxID=1214924 RepID=A0ABV8EDX7_9HYPH|nr:AraC family transcriptional regulator [Rhizobium lemnae]MCJ8507437.1 AraC family transcriptional regulator [Rhizobium lemnae]